MKPSLFALIALTMGISYSCQSQTSPKTWTPVTSITASYGGGMLYYSYEILITDSLSYMKIVSDKGPENYTRKFTKDELNSILAFLNANNFDKIKSEMGGLTHDKASEYISLTTEGKTIGVSENASTRVVEKYRDNFRNVQSYIVDLFSKKK